MTQPLEAPDVELTPDAAARLTGPETLAVTAASDFITRCQKPPAETTAALLRVIRRLAAESAFTSARFPVIRRALRVAAGEALYSYQRREFETALADLGDEPDAAS